MADKLYVVKATIETKDQKGQKIALLRSDQPQPVPGWLVKDLKAEGIIDADDEGLTAGKAAAGDTSPGGGADNSGD